MKRLYRDNVAFAYEDVGSGSQPFLFVHGWTCNHNFFALQIEYFSRFHRVIAADLCGHGASDAPQRQYTVPEFADDLAWNERFLLDTVWVASLRCNWRQRIRS